ncbi:MAG: glycosyltransferase family 9 protein [Cyclobacteriaceae bacterium]|nr:glycosyltransferase family 9 protein [Cyclobacteriaceae bacterium]
MKVLIIGYSSLGGVIFSTPVIRTLKTQLADGEIHYLMKPHVAPAMQENPYIDKILIEEQSFRKTYQQLRGERYDVIVDLSSTFINSVLTFLLRTKTYRLPGYRWKTWLMVRFGMNQLPNLHLTERMLLTIKPLGVKPDDLGLDYFIPDKDEVPLEWLPEPFRKGYVAFYMGASYNTRKLPITRMIELCDKINKPVLLLGTPEDFQAGESIAQFFLRSEQNHAWEEGLRELNKKTIIFNGCGKFNVNQTASVIRQARYVFLFDGNFIPVASAFRKEVFSIWGNTVPSFGQYPFNTRFTVLENNKLSCRPCSASGFDKCPKGHFKCMQENPFDFYLP